LIFFQIWNANYITDIIYFSEIRFQGDQKMTYSPPFIIEYSFRKHFNTSSFLKKFLMILFLPFLPIYTVSKGFQVRKWRKIQTQRPPRMWKYVIVMILVYIFTFYPLAISLFYLILQLYLFPLSLLIAYFLNKRDIEKEEEFDYELLGIEKGTFHVIGFKRFSLTFWIFLLLAILTGNVFLIITFTALVFISFPKIYRFLYFIPKKLLVLSYSFFGFLSYIPGVNLKGMWFIEADSEIKKLNNGLDLIKFIIGKWKPFFVVNAGISALTVRLILWLRGDPPVQALISIEALSSLGFLFVFLIVPIIMAIYFVWVWVWEDAEIKVAQTRFSTGSRDADGKRITETTLLTFASDSITNIFTLVFGIPSVVWLVDKMVTTDELSHGGTFGLLVIIGVFFIFTGVSTIFMGIMYYRSGIHTELVNRLRLEIQKENISKDEFSIKICSSIVTPMV